MDHPSQEGEDLLKLVVAVLDEVGHHGMDHIGQDLGVVELEWAEVERVLEERNELGISARREDRQHNVVLADEDQDWGLGNAFLPPLDHQASVLAG